MLKCNPYQIKYYFWSNGFAKNIDFELQSNGQFPFENNFKRTKNYSVSRANTNEPSTHRTVRNNSRAVLPQVSLQKSLDSTKYALDLKKILDSIFLLQNAQFCLKWCGYFLYRTKTFTPCISLLKRIMLKPGKSHRPANNPQAFFKSWKRHHSRCIFDQST